MGLKCFDVPWEAMVESITPDDEEGTAMIHGV
jgi:hypothetical protein